MNHTNKFLLTLIVVLSLVIGISNVSKASASSDQPVQAKVLQSSLHATFVSATSTSVVDNPTHLTIPNARVDAEIIPVGVTKTNNLDVPPNFVQVGWYQYGPKPGQVGNTILDGHVDNASTIDGVFKHLRDLKPGDDVYVTGAGGTQLHYKVDHSDVYLTAKFPSDIVFNQNNGQPTLKIITCHGTYIPAMGTYNQRLVVTAYLVK